MVYYILLFFVLRGAQIGDMDGQEEEESTNISGEGNVDKGPDAKNDDDEDSDDIVIPIRPENSSGLTVGAAKQFLFEQTQKHQWPFDTNCRECDVISCAIASGCTALGSSIVGSVLAGLWCRNYSWIINICVKGCATEYGCDTCN